MSRFSWIYEIEDYEKHLTAALKDYEDLALLNDILKKKTGAEATVEVIQNFLKTSIRFPEAPITALKKIYVLQNLDKPVATMARKLKVDEATVYSWIREIKGKNKSKNLKSKKDLLKDLLD